MALTLAIRRLRRRGRNHITANMLGRLCFSAALLLLAGCASNPGSDYPSLARRPIEARFAVAQTTPMVRAGPIPDDIAQRVAGWRSAADAADARFGGSLPAVDALVARASGAAIASEPWILAQQALSRLGSMRGPANDALAELDALAIERLRAEAFDGLPEIVALRDALAGQQAKQDAQLAALAARLAQ